MKISGITILISLLIVVFFLLIFPSTSFAQYVWCTTTVNQCIPAGCDELFDSSCTCGPVCSGGYSTGPSCPPGRQCAYCGQFEEGCPTGGGAPVGGGGYGYQGEYSYQQEYEYQVQYSAQPDLDITRLSFYDALGIQRPSKEYSPLEPIYLRIGITNQGSSYPSTWSRTAIYKNRQAPATVGLVSDIPMYIDSSNNWPPGTQVVYESWPGGALSNRYTTQDFRNSNIGTNYLRVFADYNNRLSEQNETEASNQTMVEYTILSPDLTVTAFDLYDQNGIQKGSASNPFFTSDQIYPRVTFSNIGTGRANAPDGQTDSRIYAHQPTVPPVGQEPNPGLTILNGTFAPGFTKDYGSDPLGPNAQVFKGSQYWTRPSPGTYTARALINFNRENIESSYANNDMNRTYVVETPYSIGGRVYYDNDASGTYTTGDVALRGQPVTLSAGPTTGYTVLTNSEGFYEFDPIRAGTYSVTLVMPQDHEVVNNGGSNVYTGVTVGPDVSNINFRIRGSYRVAGNVFVDSDQNGVKNGAEANYSGTPNVATGSKPAYAPTPRIDNQTGGLYTAYGLVGVGRWAQRSAIADYSGTGYREVQPDVGKAITSGYTTTSPEMQYTVNFAAAGTYYIWLRGYRVHGADDSVHVGLNNAAVTSGENITFSTSNSWAWENDLSTGSRATLSVPSAGVHTVNIWMREDGLRLDKMVLTRDSSYTPTGQGPAQSSVSGGAFVGTSNTVVMEVENANTTIGRGTANYTFNYTPPTGYFMINPIVPTFAVAMSGDCLSTSITPLPGGLPMNCASGNLSEVNYAISPASSWLQTVGGDLRFDKGFSDPIPGTPNAACVGPVASRTGTQSLSPGVIYSGNVNPSFGAGSASSTNWQVGTSANPELFSPVNPSTLRTSYEYIMTSASQQGTTFTQMTTVSGCSNLTSCSVSNVATGHYQANGNTVLNGFTLQANAKVVLVVNGTLRINTAIDVPAGASLVVVSKGNITVASGIGSVITGGMACPPAGHVEGFYSTNDNFILESDPSLNCGGGVRDRMLAMEGSVVVNADLNGGNFQNNRNLCDQNVNYPAFVITQRPDMILNMPSILRVPTYTWREVAP